MKKEYIWKLVVGSEMKGHTNNDEKETKIMNNPLNGLYQWK